MAQGSRSRYPHAFSPGKRTPVVSEGSWRGRARDELTISPLETTIRSLLTTGRKLKIECVRCAKSKELSALEAIASYGGLMRLHEVETALRARCRTPACRLTLGPGA